MICVYKWSINPISNPNPVESHTPSRDNNIRNLKLYSINNSTISKSINCSCVMQWFTEQKQWTSKNKMQGTIFGTNMAEVGREQK
jgi:hypothetical protein